MTTRPSCSTSPFPSLPEPMLAVAGLAKTYRASGRRSAPAVDGVTFEVEAGAFFTILGPSGCGKSTLLRCVAGLETPDAGEIRIDDQVVFSNTVELSAVARPIGMVFQSYAIWPHMTVFDNAAFPLRHGRHRSRRPEVSKRVMSMLERVGLAELAQGWATQLSGGQQQRLALARALLCDPKVLLLDEPLSNLDARLRTSLRGELKTFQRDFGVTTIYVTHDQNEALALSDRIAVMDGGRLQQVGTPEDVYSAPATAFVAAFIGSANVIPAQPHEGIFETSFGPVHATGPAVAGSLAIRPDHVRVHASEPEGPNVFPATVLASDFLGERREVTLQLQGATLRATAPALASFAPGAHVWAELPPTHIAALP
jgi:iron(III) transport system ATP-binding protein